MPHKIKLITHVMADGTEKYTFKCLLTENAT